MKLITSIQKPYTEEQRCDFIVQQNHTLGYEIRETEEELQAWGLDEQEQEEQTKRSVRGVRNSYLEKYVDPKQLVLVWNNLTEQEKLEYTYYRQYLLDYPSTEDWWKQNPLTFDEWKQENKAE